MTEPTRRPAPREPERAETPAPRTPLPRHAKPGPHPGFRVDAIDPLAQMRAALELYDGDVLPTGPLPASTLRARVVSRLRRR